MNRLWGEEFESPFQRAFISGILGRRLHGGGWPSYGISQSSRFVFIVILRSLSLLLSNLIILHCQPVPWVCLCCISDSPSHLGLLPLDHVGLADRPSIHASELFSATEWGIIINANNFIQPLRSLLGLMHMSFEGLKPGSRAKFPKPSILQLEVPLFGLC